MEQRKNLNEDDPLFRAIQRQVETRSVEFKESQPFEVLKWKLVKSCMAMANLREGGSIIIGISERSNSYELTGINAVHETSYNQDDLLALVNRYARPPISLVMRTVSKNEKRFVGIEIHPFERVPIICGQQTPQNESGKDGLRVGEIVGRTRDRISTSKVSDPDLVSEMLEVAAEKRAAEIITDII